MSHKHFILIFLATFLIFSCKKKPKKAIEELPTEVTTYQADTYLESELDSLSLLKIKDFGSKVDSAVFKEELKKISDIIKADKESEIFHTKNGVAYSVSKYGGGEYPVKGDVIQVQVETTTLDGKKIFSTKDLKQSLQFVLGVGQVVPAWDEVFVNVQEGTQFQIISPSALSYGMTGYLRSVEPNTILKYDISFEKIVPIKEDKSKKDTKLQVKEDKDSKDKENKIPVTLRKPN